MLFRSKLSILKEAPGVKQKDIDAAELEVNVLQNQHEEYSEMAQIRNMQWWSVEYGLIGEMNNPKYMALACFLNRGKRMVYA